MDTHEDTGLYTDAFYHDFIMALKTTYRMPVAPLTALNDFSNYKESGTPPPPEEFKGGDDYYAGELPRKGGNNFEFIGTALFDGDKMVGELTGIETRTLLMVRGEFSKASISVADPLDKKLRINIFTWKAF